MKRINYLASVLLAILVLFPTFPAAAESQVIGIERAEGEQLAVAIGHYNRARSLLIAALREFDLGLNHANPQNLLEVNAWRSTLMDRAQDLEKVLAPQPRVTKHGIQYQSDTRLLHEAP